MPTELLPESARLLGIVCDALRLTLPPERKANGRRFLTGERALPAEARIAVVRTLVEDALALGYLGEVAGAAVGKERDEWIELVTSSAIVLMRRWDHAVGHLTAVQLRHVERNALVTACLRAAIVDVAIRAAALRLLAKLPSMSPATKTITFTEAPPWARAGGAARGLALRVRARGVTRDALHESNTLDDWLSGRRRPSPENLRKLAPKIAGNEPVGAWQHHLLWDFGLAYLADAVRPTVGDAVIEDLAAALRRITCLCMRPMAALAEARGAAALDELVRWGAMTPIAREICEWLQQQEALSLRLEWARALALGGRPWSLLWFVAAMPPVPEAPNDPSIPHEVIERLLAWNQNPDREATALFDICTSHPSLFVWLTRMTVHRAVSSGDFDLAALIVSRLADAVGGATLHLEAAALLAGANQHDEAERHLAAIPTDDVLRSAADGLVAMMHVTTGRHREALDALETVDDGGPVILRARAEALLGLGQPSAALALVDRVINGASHDALALELAARCCTALGRTRDATRYAKAADRLGRPQVLESRAGRRVRRRA